MSTHQIVASGVGGQGLLSFAEVLGQAAASAGKNVTVTTFYGSESRGTFTKADLIISDEAIAFPECRNPDIVLCFAQVAYDRYVNTMRQDAVLIYDSELVAADPACAATQYGRPFTSMARELGRTGSANLISAGFMLKMTGFFDPAVVERSLEDRFAGNEKMLKINIDAFRAGVNLE